MSKYFRWLELPERKDVYTWEGTTEWGNHDLYPIPKKERTYGVLGYFSYFLTSTISVTGFTGVSAYVAGGLSAWETVGAILVGSTIAGLNSFLGGQPGIDHRLGFTMMTRVTFGLRGCRFPLFTQLFGNVIFSGINGYYGGQAITLILGAVIPQFQQLPNTLPDSAGIVTRDLIGFILYFLIFIPLIWFIPMFQLRKFLYPSIVMSAISLFGILGWIVHENGGPGNLVSPAFTISNQDRAFLFLQCVSSTASVWGGSGDRLSDWTRYSRSRHASTPAMLGGLAVTYTLVAIMGVIATSAFNSRYGELLWSPVSMLLYVQDVDYSATCRAGTFFAGIGLLSSTLYINLVQNIVPFGMDFCGVFPRYLSMRRAGVLLCIVGMACNPWRFLTQAAVFVQAMSVFAVFAGVTTAVQNADYWLIRQRKWKIPDLYHPEGIYWYTGGFNLRAIAAWTCAIIPTLPGFVHSMMGGEYLLTADYKMYQMTFFIGYPLGIIFYVTICKIWPPSHIGIQEDFPEPDESDGVSGTVIDGVPTDVETKAPAVTFETEKSRSGNDSI